MNINNKKVKGKYFWTTKDGRRIDIDEMSIDHLRNTLKMIVRQIETSGFEDIGFDPHLDLD